jgi:hypothetical protein
MYENFMTTHGTGRGCEGQRNTSGTLGGNPYMLGSAKL